MTRCVKCYEFCAFPLLFLSLCLVFDCKEDKDLSHRGTSWIFTGYGDKASSKPSASQPRKQSNPRKEMHDKLMSEALLKVEHKQVASLKLALYA